MKGWLAVVGYVDIQDSDQGDFKSNVGEALTI